MVRRNENVQVHAEITQATNELVACIISDTLYLLFRDDYCGSASAPSVNREMQLPSKVFKERA